ncbi:hypothetical protein HID58_086646, partial [Brassica napus]
SRLLIGQDIIPERVIILDSIQSRNFRGRLSPDETLAAKLETSSEKKAVTSRVNLDYFPPGSVIDGLSASLLSRALSRFGSMNKDLEKYSSRKDAWIESDLYI